MPQRQFNERYRLLKTDGYWVGFSPMDLTNVILEHVNSRESCGPVNLRFWIACSAGESLELRIGLPYSLAKTGEVC